MELIAHHVGGTGRDLVRGRATSGRLGADPVDTSHVMPSNKMHCVATFRRLRGATRSGGRRQRDRRHALSAHRTCAGDIGKMLLVRRKQVPERTSCTLSRSFMTPRRSCVQPWPLSRRARLTRVSSSSSGVRVRPLPQVWGELNGRPRRDVAAAGGGKLRGCDASISAQGAAARRVLRCR